MDGRQLTRGDWKHHSPRQVAVDEHQGKVEALVAA